MCVCVCVYVCVLNMYKQKSKSKSGHTMSGFQAMHVLVVVMCLS